MQIFLKTFFQVGNFKDEVSKAIPQKEIDLLVPAQKSFSCLLVLSFI